MEQDVHLQGGGCQVWHIFTAYFKELNLTSGHIYLCVFVGVCVSLGSSVWLHDPAEEKVGSPQ